MVTASAVVAEAAARHERIQPRHHSRPLRAARPSRYPSSRPAAGPIALALLMARNDRLGLAWPFHKEASPKFGLHLLVGFVVGVLPVYQLVALALQ